MLLKVLVRTLTSMG